MLPQTLVHVVCLSLFVCMCVVFFVPAVLRNLLSCSSQTWTETEAEKERVTGLENRQLKGRERGWERASRGVSIPPQSETGDRDGNRDSLILTITDFPHLSSLPFWFCFALVLLCEVNRCVFPSVLILFLVEKQRRGDEFFFFCPSVFLFNFVFVLFL